MSDTPRTDAAVKQLLQVSRPERVSVDFARELEREIARLTEQINQLRAQERVS
jgi:predicted transcriptional regulator